MEKINEFWYCVSSQEELPLYATNNFKSNALLKLISDCKAEYTKLTKNSQKVDKNNAISRIILDIIIKTPNSIEVLRQLAGISDKRLYLDLTYIFNRAEVFLPEDKYNLKKHDTKYFIRLLKQHKKRNDACNIVHKYFIDKNVVDMLSEFICMPDNHIEQIYQSLIVPKETQQKDAKYRGHSCEMHLAKILKYLDIKFLPSNKDTELMGDRDKKVNLATMDIVTDKESSLVHSFDLIILDKKDNIRVLVQSLIHSSDPGQYGVNKSDETTEIKVLIDKYNSLNPNKKVYLWGMVDGVGFSENPNNTICKMLKLFDEFIQIKTLFKAAAGLQKIGLINNVASITFSGEYFEQNIVDFFIDRYLSPAKIVCKESNFSFFDATYTKIYITDALPV